jgi:uncharacterized protein (DUF2141 family)
MSPVRFVSSFAVAAFLTTSAVAAADLTLRINHVRSDAGVISVALYDAKDRFLADGAAVRTTDVRAMEGETPVVFNDLPPGEYAAAVFHDENSSGAFDTNFLGLPEEGYGFSNGTRAGFGPPSFDEAAVAVTSEAVTEVEMTY